MDVISSPICEDTKHFSHSFPLSQLQFSSSWSISLYLVLSPRADRFLYISDDSFIFMLVCIQVSGTWEASSLGTL